MTTVATLDIRIGADIRGLTQGLNTANRGLGDLAKSAGNKLKDVGGNIQKLGGQMTLATAPIAGALFAGIGAASSFESAMAEIQARTGLTADEMQKVSDFALKMGADTAFSAQDAADAMLELLASGQSVNEAMATLPSVLTLAAAGSIGLGLAADATTDIMSQFGLEVTDAGNIVQNLSAAAASSSADVNDLILAFQNAGGVASNFGLSVEDTSAILAVFAENGIKGAEAGTQLKSMLLNMTRPTDDVQAAWERLGTSLYDAQGNIRPLEEVIGELDAALDALPIQEQNELMYQLAGSYGITGLTALRGAVGITEMKDRMDDAASASSVADAKMDTFAGRLDSLKGSVETLMITALTPFMNDVLKPLAEEATKIINSFTEWAKANPELANTVIMIAGAATVAGPALFILGTAVTAIGTAIGVVLSPLALLVAGIAALVALAPTIPATIDTWRQNFENFGLIVETIFQDIARRITVALDDIGRAIQTKFAELEVTKLQLEGLFGVDEEASRAALAKLGSLYSIDMIVATLESQMGTGAIDLSENITFTLPGGATFTDTIANIIATGDTSLISEGLRWQLEDAFAVAIASGDFATAGQILAVAPRLELDLDEADAQAQIVTQLVSAVQSGDQSLYFAALNMAVQLGLDPISIQEQVRAQVTAAAEAANPSANVGVNVTATVTNLGEILGSVMAQVQGAIAGSSLGQSLAKVGQTIGATIGLPGYDTGIGYVPQTQAAILHRGEAVLTAGQNRQRMRGEASAGNTTIILNNPMGDGYGLMTEIDKAKRRSRNFGGRRG